MSYPMNYQRVVNRNHLAGDYDSEYTLRSCVAGDLRRLETDQRDEKHLKKYAGYAGVTPEQAKLVLDAFFDGFVWKIPQ